MCVFFCSCRDDAAAVDVNNVTIIQGDEQVVTEEEEEEEEEVYVAASESLQDDQEPGTSSAQPTNRRTLGPRHARTVQELRGPFCPTTSSTPFTNPRKRKASSSDLSSIMEQEYKLKEELMLKEHNMKMEILKIKQETAILKKMVVEAELKKVREGRVEFTYNGDHLSID